MIKLPHVGKAIYLLCLIAVTNVNGQNRAQDHNSSRSNKTSSKAAPDPDAQARAQDHNSSRSNKSGLAAPDDAWTFGMSTGASFGLKSKESSLFRGNSMATKMFGRYNFGHVGLGFNTGIIPGTISSTAISEFLTERKFPVDALITSTKPLNAYFLFGPSFSFGEKVKISADINGGIFYNHAGGLSINQQGATRALYRFDAGSKNLMPGLSGNISIAYPLNNSTRFFINTDYLQTISSIRLLDPQRGIDIATEQNRSVKLFTAGVGITKSFGGRDAASGQASGKRISAPRDPASGLATGKRISSPRDPATGQASGKRVLPTVNKREITIDEGGAHRILSPRDPASGLATGKRISSPRDPASGLATGKRISSPRDPASGLATGKRSAMDDDENNESCGPVTLKKTNADGSTEERTFACPGDAVQYQKQTQGATFGEKVNQGLHAAGSAMSQGATFGEKVNQGLHSAGSAIAQGAARNILAGKVTWSSGSSSGIVTNKTKLAGGAGGGAAAASYASTGMVINNGGGTGISTAIYARDAASGMASGKRSADAGSGMSTGRRQYAPVFFEGGNNDCTDCIASAVVNPYFKNNGNAGEMVPMNKSSNGTAADNSCNGISGLKVYLVDAVSGAAVASTQTEACGEFWFANVPTGDYVVKLSGGFIAKKGYDINFKNKGSYDVAGEILAADDFFSVEIITAEGTPEEAAALIKTKTKSNQSNDRVGKASINTTRSNIKNMAVSLADSDDDGVAEIWIGDVIMDAQMDEASLLGGALPGGAVISAAMRPGGPIGGIIVKGGKNPGGQMRTTNTNEFGEFEFTNWDEGNYTITADLNYVIADETLVSVGDDYIGENINTTESNLKDIPPAANKGNGSNRLGKIDNNMPNRISMNVTVPKQTQGATFGEKVGAGMMDNNSGNNPTMKARNNNTVRSNRTDNALINVDLDNDGSMESSYLTFSGEVATITINNNEAAGKVVEKATSGLKDVIKTQVRMAGEKLPVKWSAPEVLVSRVWGDPHVDEKDGRLSLGVNNQIVQKEKWQASPVAIKSISCADGTCAIISGTPDDFSATSRISLNGLPPGQPVARAAVWFVDNSGTVYKGETNENGRISLNGLPPGVPVRMLMNLCADGSDDFIITFSTDAQGNAVSSVLKTKHDTAKNSIGNIR